MVNVPAASIVVLAPSISSTPVASIVVVVPELNATEAEEATSKARAEFISIPPAVAFIVIASKAPPPSEDDIFTDDPVATISISSVGPAPDADISIPPTVDVI